MRGRQARKAQRRGTFSVFAHCLLASSRPFPKNRFRWLGEEGGEGRGGDETVTVHVHLLTNLRGGSRSLRFSAWPPLAHPHCNPSTTVAAFRSAHFGVLLQTLGALEPSSRVIRYFFAYLCLTPRVQGVNAAAAVIATRVSRYNRNVFPAANFLELPVRARVNLRFFLRTRKDLFGSSNFSCNMNEPENSGWYYQNSVQVNQKSC